MIQKIQNGEYLKRVDNMSLAERNEYSARVGEWLKDYACMLLPRMKDEMAKFQDVLQCSVYWNDAECKAWMDGVRLLTSLVAVTETWLPDLLFVKSAKRAIRKLFSELQQVESKTFSLKKTAGSDVPKLKTAPVVKPQGASQGTPSAATKAKEEPAEGTQGVTQAVVTKPLPSGEQAVPVRPKHIDQYIHLLPKATQEKAATVRGLLREMDVARENARKLMDAGEHPDKIAQWAKTATKLDDKLKAIYREVDREWDKLVKKGVVGVDDFGNAFVKSTEHTEKTEDTEAKKQRGRPAMTEEEKAQRAAEKAEKRKQENQRKSALIRKWLIDKRNAVTDEQKQKWMQKYKEMVKLGGEDAVTDKVREAAEYYGVKLKK